MGRATHLLALAVVTSGLFFASGCSVPLNPTDVAINIVGRMVDDEDVQMKSRKLIGASSAQVDSVLGAPEDVYRDPRGREWRIYRAKYDLVGLLAKYMVEFSGDIAIAINKADSNPDIILDAAIWAHFREHCTGQTPEACQRNIGQYPSLSVRSIKTGERMDLYDARLIGDMQRPYFGVVHFSPKTGTCNKVTIMQIMASS